MEGELKRLLQLAKEAGLSATLTFVVKGGKTRARLEVDLDSERRPLKHLPPAPDGRQAVLTVGRRALPSFASLNMDGSPPSLPPGPPTPPPPAVQTFPNLKLRLWKSGRLNTFAHNFRDRIYTLSVMVGVERYRWEHCSSRPVGVPPWHSSS